ncbi:MAG: hypothetical protein LBU80_01275 [Rikenellaceae bacterium]|jgi:hypothetical protein|nr:hypothetical protein [Rikenellaceae bacterium]
MGRLEAKAKSTEIADVLFRHIETGEIFELQQIGLYSGKFVILFFLAHCMLEDNDPQHFKLFVKYATHCLAEVSNGKK